MAGSIRTNLIWSTAGGTLAVVLVAGLLLDGLIRRRLLADFDASLATKINSFATLVEQTGAGLDFELTELPPPEYQPGPDAEAYQLWDADGRSVARSPSLESADLTWEKLAGATPAIRDGELPGRRRARVALLRFSPTQDLEDGGSGPRTTATLALARQTRTLDDTVAAIRAVLVVVGVATIALVCIVLAAMVRIGLRPLERLSHNLAQTGAGDLTLRADPDGLPDELRPIAARLNELLARLSAALERERRFTGDAAHELRTPLAGLRARLELALSRPREADAYRAALSDSLAISRQLQRLVETLLQLARADAGQIELRRAVAKLAEIVAESWNPFASRAAARRLRVELLTDAERVVRIDVAILRAVLANLFENAVTYADAGGDVEIDAADSRWLLRVSNSGCKLGPDELPRVFERFWRGRSTAAGEDAHCGLGLPLCRALLAPLGATIEACCDPPDTFVVCICTSAPERAGL